MRAVIATEPGGPEVLRVIDVPDVRAGPGELLIDVEAAGVNRADLLQREGLYPPPPGASPILGLEVAGTVATVGADVEGWNPGDRAMALVAGGGYAERVVVRARHALPIPDGMGSEAAAAVPEAFLTSALSLRHLAPLDAGGRLLVHAAASGVGTAAIQIGGALGARVAGTVRTPSKADRVRQLGAEPIVVSADGRFAARARGALGGGASVVLDLVGAAYWNETVDSLDMDGTISVVGLLGGSEPSVDLSALMRRRARVVASTLRPLPESRKDDLVSDFRAWGLPLLAGGRLSPCLDATFDIEDVAGAHIALASNETLGKLVLRIDQL